MIDVNKTPRHDWERELQELQRKHDATVNRDRRNSLPVKILLFGVVMLALVIMCFKVWPHSSAECYKLYVMLGEAIGAWCYSI